MSAIEQLNKWLKNLRRRYVELANEYLAADLNEAFVRLKTKLNMVDDMLDEAEKMMTDKT